jgi:hypothetical protein
MLRSPNAIVDATTRDWSAMIPGSPYPRAWPPWFVDASGLMTRDWFVQASVQGDHTNALLGTAPTPVKVNTTPTIPGAEPSLSFGLPPKHPPATSRSTAPRDSSKSSSTCQDVKGILQQTTTRSNKTVK